MFRLSQDALGCMMGSVFVLGRNTVSGRRHVVLVNSVSVKKDLADFSPVGGRDERLVLRRLFLFLRLL